MFAHLDVVKVLLHRNSNVEFRNKNGETALIWASSIGNVEIMGELLDRNASMDKNGGNALIVASRHGHLEVIKAHLHRQSNVDIQD